MDTSFAFGLLDFSDLELSTLDQNLKLIWPRMVSYALTHMSRCSLGIVFMKKKSHRFLAVPILINKCPSSIIAHQQNNKTTQYMVKTRWSVWPAKNLKGMYTLMEWSQESYCLSSLQTVGNPLNIYKNIYCMDANITGHPHHSSFLPWLK